MKVLIVDDEVIIRTGLCTVINWEDSGFTVLEPAASAEEALLRIPVERPEIIFTDIRMTGKSGLDMVHEVKKDYPDTEMIIISGFDEFAYAQQAMREGVSDYLLKTSRPDEIIHAALRAKERLEQRKQTDEQGRARETVVSQSFLRSLLTSTARPDEQTLIELEERYPELRMSKGKHLLQIWIISIQEEYREGSCSVEHLNGVFGTFVQGLLPCEWLQWNDSLLLIVKMEIAPQGWEPVESAILKAEQMLSCQTFAACGRTITDMRDIHDALHTAIEASNYAWLLGHDRNVRYEEIAARKGIRMICTVEEEAALASLLRAGSRDRLREGVAAIVERVKQNQEATPGSFQAYLQSLLIAGHRWLERAATSIGYANSLSNGEEVDKRELATRPEETLYHHLEDVMNQYRLMVSGSSPVQRAVVYIQDHLDQSLSLAQVAKHVHMNPNYFSEIFKKETGQNYLEFVTQAKLRKAMSMLRETPAKISEVANHIGYEDMKYFNRLFKKFTGQTPSEYRGKC